MRESIELTPIRAQLEWPRGACAGESGRTGKGPPARRPAMADRGSVGVGIRGMRPPMGGTGPAVQDVQAVVPGDLGSAVRECKAVPPLSCTPALPPARPAPHDQNCSSVRATEVLLLTQKPRRRPHTERAMAKISGESNAEPKARPAGCRGGGFGSLARWCKTSE
jgi:hypothetical protein